MLSFLRKHTPAISTLLLVALLATLLFSPASSHSLSIMVIIFSIGTATTFTIHKNWAQRKGDELTKSEFIRNTALDLLGIALTMSAAIWLGRMLGGYAGQAVGMNVGQGWGMVTGIAAGMVGGFAAAFVVGRVWGTVNNRLRVASAIPKA